MSLYPDTSFLCAMYRPQENSDRADAFNRSRRGPLPVTTLLLLEFRQSVRFQVRLFAKDRRKGFPKPQAAAMLQALQSDLSAGLLEIKCPDWADVHRLAETLSAKYTETGGHRFADLLHVATALHFGVQDFVTFDDHQRVLAEAEGLRIPL